MSSLSKRGILFLISVGDLRSSHFSSTVEVVRERFPRSSLRKELRRSRTTKEPNTFVLRLKTEVDVNRKKRHIGLEGKERENFSGP